MIGECKMKAVRCKNGHWYDSETYDKCPHCGQMSAEMQTHSIEHEQDKKGFSLFKKRKKNEAKLSSVEVERTPAPVSRVPSTPAVEYKAPSTPSITHDEVTERFFADIDDDKTMSMFALGNMTENVKNKTVSEPLSVAVQRVSAMDEGKTLSYFNTMTSHGDSTGSDMTKRSCEPIVGWLVAISGPHFGDSFQIYVGKNTVGRSQGNKVVLELDNGVSRENHATIIYEPKRREFYLQSGSSDGLIYLNDSFVNGSEILKPRDTLEIGASKLLFVPLCGTDFSWEQYM